jgi:hypothetical protein
MTYPDNERGQAAFEFDHAIEHRSITTAIGNPSLFNLQNYLLNPALGQDIANGNWQMQHQQAHDDAGAYFGVPSLPMIGEGPKTPQWLFINSTEHSALNGAILAASLA